MNPVFSIRKVLKDAFNACIDNFKTLFIRMLQMYAYQLLFCLPIVLFFGLVMSPFEFLSLDTLGMVWPTGWTLCSMILFICYVNLHMQYQRFAWRALHNQAIPSFRLQDFSFMVLGLAILLSVIIICGYLLLIVPGIYLSLRFGYAYIVYAIEEKSITDSLRRSWELTRGHTVKTLALFCIVTMLRPLSLITYPFIETINISTYKQLVDVAYRH